MATFFACHIWHATNFVPIRLCSDNLDMLHTTELCRPIYDFGMVTW